KLVKVDYEDKEALRGAIQGQDAALITLNGWTTLEKNSKTIIDIAIEEGVKRVIPSEFGIDMHHWPGTEHTFFTPQINVSTYLKEKAAAGLIEYTSVSCGFFFDWSLKLAGDFQFTGMDIPNKTATIFNGGNAKANLTNQDSVVHAILYILSDLSILKNQDLLIHDFFVSQNEILEVLEQETDSKWTIKDVDAEALLKESQAGLDKGDFSFNNVCSVLKVYAWGKESSSRWGDDDDSALLKLPKRDMRDEIKKVLGTA
ncbi:12634_t:CDS:2, partial [Acaulospora colombiana]